MADFPALSPAAYHPYGGVEEFILGCTDEIWVDRDVASIAERYYAPGVVVHAASGSTPGVGPVIEGTLQGISSCPDEVGRGEDVVWEARGPDSFVSSHRVLATGTNSGWTAYGPPAHRRFTRRALAHCLVRGGQITQEWLVRDEYRLVTDLGHDPRAVADRLAQRGPWRPLELGELPVDPLRAGASGPRPPDGGDGQRILDLIELTWNQRRLAALRDHVHGDVALHTTRGRLLQGVRDYSTETVDILAAIPDAQLRVIDICCRDDPGRGSRVAVVWLLAGTYTGHERFGPAGGQQVQLLGSSQYLMAAGRVREEYRVYDEIALMAQIARGGAAGVRSGGVGPAADQPDRETLVHGLGRGAMSDPLDDQLG